MKRFSDYREGIRLLANGLEFCFCPKTKCERHGSCEECMSYHKANKRFAPYCMRVGKKNKKAPPDPKKN